MNLIQTVIFSIIGENTLDYKDFHDGLLSLSLVLFFFSLTFLIGSILLEPYISLEFKELNFIVAMCSINFLFCIYYLWQVQRLERIFRLENKNIVKYGKKLGFFTLLYLPHFFIFSTLFFADLHELELLMVFLIFIMEVLLLGLVLKEVYDLVFQDEFSRNFEIEQNRKKYIEKD